MTHHTAQAWALYALLGVAYAQSIEFTAPATPPAIASDPVDPSFLGLMVESTSYPDYGDQVLSQTLMRNIVTKTGAPVVIRVGGTSGDQFVYNASQQQPIVRDDPNNGNLTANRTVGPAWLEGFTHLGKDARYVLSVPLARNQLDRTIEFTKAAVQVIGKDNLEAIEIGNEPDLYACTSPSAQCKRPKGYDLSDWVQEFLKYADAISKNVDLPSGPIYQAGAFAWHPDHPQWTPQDAYSLGLNTSNRIKTFANHYYQTHVGNSLHDKLLNHTETITRTNTLNSSLTYIHTKHPGVQYVLGEVGDALGTLSQTGEKQLDAVLGSALWEVDWLLYAMASSYDRVSMNQCKRCNFASWWTAQTDPTAAAVVRAQYFGLVFVADFLGGVVEGANSSLPLRVAPITNPKYPYLSSYAGYLDGKLDLLAVVELTEWNVTSTSPRPVRQITFDLPADVKSAELRRLIGNGTDSEASDMSYAGVRYSAGMASGQLVGNSVEHPTILNNRITFQLPASEAALIKLRRS